MKKFQILLISILCFQATDLFCQVKLPRLISDGVVLQRGEELKLWGWASPDETVELLFKNKEYQTRADRNGNWFMLLPAQKAGGPYQMHFAASNRLTVENVLIGDVWLASGQSNMELPMERVKEKYSEIIAQAENSRIRQFMVPDAYDFRKEHTDFAAGNWESADPNTVLHFSAVAYFFAKELNERYGVPIGIINASLGGSPVEAWMSEDALKKFPSAYDELQQFKNDSLIRSIEASDKERMEQWYHELHQKDRGLASSPQWQETAVADHDWDEMEIPAYWANEAVGNVNGVVWFRKQLNIPEAMAGKPAALWLGRIVDQDYAYLNGELVGTTSYQYPPRRYEVEPAVLKAGENTLVVRVVNNSGKGGFVQDKPYYLAVGEDTIDLTGMWKYKLGASMEPLESQTFIRWKPGGLYKRMIAPLLNFSMKGVIWYQGESNTSNPQLYGETFPAMISDWRKNWGQGSFPFIYVQLANFMEESAIPMESNWAALRQAQLNTLKVPNTGMAVAIDLGEWNDIHPLNKKDVGKRLALQAMKLAYKEKEIAGSSPVPVSADFQRNKVVITFEGVGKGLVANGEELKHFSISGDGERFVWAKATISEDRVTVWNEKIDNPKVVRYAWGDNPEAANLYTKEGLPASPFEIEKE